MNSSYQVHRGGCWYNGDASDLATRARGWFAPSYRDFGLGFRCARVAVGTQLLAYSRPLHRDLPWIKFHFATRSRPKNHLGLRCVVRGEHE